MTILENQNVQGALMQILKFLFMFLIYIKILS